MQIIIIFYIFHKPWLINDSLSFEIKMSLFW